MSVEPSDFHKKLNEYIIESPGRMYIFEVTKLCGYSTFVFMYKDETLLDLYNRISHHFGCQDIKGLYIDSHLHKKSTNNNTRINDSNNNSKNNNKACCCTDKDNLISVPFSSLTSVKDFIFNNTAKEPRNLAPIYPLPLPVVYRIYLDDGHCHDHKC